MKGGMERRVRVGLMIKAIKDDGIRALIAAQT
jgi:hypothetical protein